MKRYIVKGAFVGITLALSMYGLLQDFLGKERYIEHVQNHWIPGCISAPIEIILIIWCLIYFVGGCLQEDEDRRSKNDKNTSR